MFRMWAREFRSNHMLRDTVVEKPGDMSRTKKVFAALQEACVRLDLQVPIWLETNIRDFQRTSCTRFTSDNFTEEIPFDYLEIRMIEEDDD